MVDVSGLHALRASWQTIPTNPQSGYERLSRKEARSRGLGPHGFYYRPDGTCGYLLTLKSEVGADYSLNHEAMVTCLKMCHEMKFKQIYIAQVDPEDPSVLMARKPVQEVAKYLRDEDPRPGEYGDYFFLEAHSFYPSGSPMSSNSRAQTTLKQSRAGTFDRLLREGYKGGDSVLD